MSIYIFCPIFLVIILLFIQLSFICLACYNPAHCFVYSHHLPRIFIDILLYGLESPYHKGTCPSQNCTQNFFSFLPISLLIFLIYKYFVHWNLSPEWHDMGFPGGTSGKEPACKCKRRKRYWFDPSSILTWKTSWTEKPGGLQSIGSQRVGHN